MRRRDKILLTLSLIIPLILYFSSELSMIWSGTSCAKVLYLDKIKGSTYVYFSYSVEGEMKTASRSIRYFKYRNLEKLKEKPCFWVSYSKIIPSNTRIVDRDIGNE